MLAIYKNAVDDTLPGCVMFFDKIAFRTNRSLSKRHLQYLRKHCNHADLRLGRPIPNSDSDFLLTIVAPTESALKYLARRSWLIPNYVEVALDFLTRDQESAQRLRDIFDHCFVQQWHGKDELHPEENGSYTRRNRPGVRFAWYGDRPCKLIDLPSFHIEARAHGMAAVRRIGLHHARDLLKFDHISFWKKNLNLYQIDLDRLGRWYGNRQLGKRRRKMACTRFRRHRVRCFHGTGGASWRGGSLRESSSLRLCA